VKGFKIDLQKVANVFRTKDANAPLVDTISVSSYVDLEALPRVLVGPDVWKLDE
jgi:hypothetical protein